MLGRNVRPRQDWRPPLSVPLSARLDAVQSLAEVAQSALPLGLNAIFMTPEGVLGIAKPPRPSRLHFVVDGLPFHVSVSPDGENGAICQVWAEVGHIPYTAQAPERRRNLLNLLRGMQDLKRARFIVQEGHKILLFTEDRIDGHMTMDDLVYETVLLIQEARPFLRLLGEYL